MNAEPANAGPRLPEITGYRLLRRLGQGGMAEVFLGIQLSLQREIAIKVMAFDNAVSEELAARFEREARTIARLDHPNVVGIHEVGRTRDGMLYYTMPYLANGHLGQRDLRGDTPAVLRVMQQIGEALEYAHAQGVVHRDVKPENILFDKADRPLLTDFGIALDTGDGHHRVTGRGKTLGSSAYMSPEQARDSEIDGRADLYSLGVVCFEMLTGDLPFHGSDSLAMAIAHLEQPVPRLPPALRAWQPFIDRALAKSANDRLQTAGELLDALHAVEDSLQAAAARRDRGARGPLLTALAVTAAVAIAWWASGRIGSGPSAPAPAAARAPVSVLDAATLDRELRAAHALIAKGRLVEPDDSAAARFLALLQGVPDLAEARAGLDASIAAAAGAAEKRIAAGRGADASELYEMSYAMAQRSAIPDYPAWSEFERRFGDAIKATLDRALRRLDRSAGASLAPAIAVVARDRPALGALAQTVSRLPAPGARARDRGGPLLALVPGAERGAPERPFAIAVYEVTRGEYTEFARAQGRGAARCRDGRNPISLLRSRDWRKPGFGQAADEPVVCVSAADARAYAAWLSQRTGADYRLPTRTQWRHVAAGIATDGNPCKLGNVLGQEGEVMRLTDRHECRDAHPRTAPVGRYAAGPYGVYDLAGNVREWLADCQRGSGSGNCSPRALAGSSWRDGENRPLTATDSGHDDETGETDLGFRLLREFDPAKPPPAVAP